MCPDSAANSVDRNGYPTLSSPTIPSMKIGIISDTHGMLRPEAVHALQGVDHIIHAGDIGKPSVLEGLNHIAPATAVRGNVDSASWAEEFPTTVLVEFEGRSIYVLHDLAALDLNPKAAGIDCVISGHSHRPLIKERDGILYVNPGSAGPRRFHLPITLAFLEIEDEITASIIELIT